jgi:TolB-like protein/DNA-binding winged helix-turn-helix (wHTH) protein/Flp pilus assembly protein TadD
MKPVDPSASVPQTFQLADWKVDVASNRIRRGDAETKLETKMMAVLAYLADRRGEVVTRDALQHAIWNGRFVSYDVLTVCMNKLRKTLGDDPRQPRYIETIAKKGYRLIAEVTPLAPPAPVACAAPLAAAAPAKSGARRVWTATAVLAGVAVLAVVHFTARAPQVEPLADEARLPALAVLPFSNLNRDAQQDYLSDGLTADITTTLSGNAELFVIANPSVLAYKNQDIDASRVADTLGVRYLLQGTVQRTDARLRVNAQLVDARSGVQLWAERYDRDVKDIFEMQDDIVARITGALEVKLSSEEKKRMARRYTASVEAYDAFLRGQTAFSHRTPDDNLLARASYEQAITLDPNFARAYSALALTYTQDFRFGWNAAPSTSLARAFTLARKAVELDDGLSQAQWVLGHVQLHRHEFEPAKHAAQQAIRLNPNFADGYMALANVMIYTDASAAALPLIRKAMRLNPRYPAQYAEILGQAYYFLDRHEEAVAALHDATERNANLLPSYVFLAAAQSGLGDTTEARWTLDQLRMLMPSIGASDVTGMFPIENPARVATIVERLRTAGL